MGQANQVNQMRPDGLDKLGGSIGLNGVKWVE